MDDLLGPDALRTFAVAGDLADCRRTARLLRDLAAGAKDTAAFLAGQEGTAKGLSGLSGTAYRRRCQALGAGASGLARSAGELATGLADLADELDGARDVMARAEGIASSAGLVVAETLVPPETALPGSASGADAAGRDVEAAWTAWSRARALIRRARMLENVAQQAWSMMLLRFARPLGAGPSDPDDHSRVPERPSSGSGSDPGSVAGPRRPRVPSGTPEPGSPPGPRPGPHPDPGDPPRDDPPRDEHPERQPAPEPWICVLTPPEPDDFCGTPDITIVPWEPKPPETEVYLPGLLGRSGGAGRSGVTDRAEH